MRVTVFSCGPAANESELKACEHLKHRLQSMQGDQEWILLTNLSFSVTHQLQSDEIDIVTIGPPGIRVIEVKHWTGQWIDKHKDLVEQEADRVTNKARKIGTTLRKTTRNLARVDGAFLVTREPSRGKRLAGRKVRGVDFHTLAGWKDAIGFDGPTELSLNEVRMLGSVLEPKSRVVLDGSLRHLAGYINLELQTPKEERFRRIYKGIHSARQDRVVLYLYDLSAADGNTDVKARREFEALRHLQRYDWAPRILDSYQDAPGYAGEMFFFTIADPAAPCIEKRASDDSWDTTARLSFARSTVRALGELRDATTDDECMVHRNLTPKTILVKHDNSPILIGFEKTRIPSDISVASAGGSAEESKSEISPEVRAQGLSAADHRSDVYSLCASLAKLFRGREDEESLRVERTLAMGLEEEPGARAALQDLESSLSGLLGEPAPHPAPPPARFWTEGQVVLFRDRDYRIVEHLGSGGVGTVFKVVEIDRSTEGDLGTYVAKVARDQETGRRVLKAYDLARSHLGRHAALSTIFEVAPEWQENDFSALMAWIEGVLLHDFIGVFPLLAEDQQENSAESLALRWLRTMCEGLQVLHRNGLMHGDVSPRNMIISEGDLVLTDYDFVGKLGDRIAAPGTVLYCSTSHLDHREASPSDDIYALAASFFHVVFDKKPFRYGGIQDKKRGLNWEGVNAAEYHVLPDFLNKATHPDPEHRFTSAAEALAALSVSPSDETQANTEEEKRKEPEPETPVDLDKERTAQIERRENQVGWLRSLLQSYPGSRWGNRETRGLDTEFAALTYVETNVEEALYRDIYERRVRLVILCGNAGDGKTALLQHLADRLGFGKQASLKRIIEGRLADGLVVRMNLDGSAAWQGDSADDLLNDFLGPFQDGPPSEDIARLLAINDGRLLEWIGGVIETPLEEELNTLLEGKTLGEDSHIRFISLNQRSLVGSITPEQNAIETNFLERLLDRLYGGEKAPEVWAPCRTCSAQERCEVFRAARIFGPEGLPDLAPKDIRARARQRLFEALQAVHLRGETHITVRELRSTLIYILFGVRFCQDYHAGHEGLAYWDRAFSPGSLHRQGEVLRELVRFDPALEAHPRIDRRLLRALSSDSSETGPDYEGLTLESARRRAYFEWTEHAIEEVSGERHALDLARGRHLRLFRDVPLKKEPLEHADLCKRLCRGISRLEDLPPRALARSGVPLRITPRTPTETAFWVEKPLTSFRLEDDLPPEEKGLDRLHRHAFLIYRYRVGNEERLRLGAELFHLLLELGDGYQLGDVSTDDTFAHLSIFVQRLVREDDRAVFAWNPMRDEEIYRISEEVEYSDKDPRQQMEMVIRSLAKGDQE